MEHPVPPAHPRPAGHRGPPPLPDVPAGGHGLPEGRSGPDQGQQTGRVGGAGELHEDLRKRHLLVGPAQHRRLRLRRRLTHADRRHGRGGAAAPAGQEDVAVRGHRLHVRLGRAAGGAGRHLALALRRRGRHRQLGAEPAARLARGPARRAVELDRHPWLNDTVPLYIALVVCVVWAGFPFIAVSVLAGLKGIPAELYEAARVDGSGPWHTFRRITLPLLKPVFAVLTILSIIWDFKVFSQLYVLMNGPTNRDGFNLSMYAVAEAFKPPPKLGTGAAISVVLTIILLIITVVYVRQIVKQEEM
ncbi:carbohydrate ABC transporter permease [Nonomuraea antimicrobica]